MKPKLLIIGHARHGKDTVAEMLRDQYGFKFASSSLFAAEHVTRPYLRHFGIFYPTVQDCYEDRHNHRAHWHAAIRDYTKDDPTRLAREVLVNHDIYVGMRHNTELNACRIQGVFDFIIWVDRGNVLPPEDFSSMKLHPWMADFILDNNGDLDALKRNLEVLVRFRILQPPNVLRRKI
jgi:hypothetical protein